jgi:hypothetical protein
MAGKETITGKTGDSGNYLQLKFEGEKESAAEIRASLMCGIADV